MDSILTSVKKLLGLPADYEAFDPDIIMYINTVLMILTQMGVGPKEGFFISDKSTTWNQFIADPVKVEAVKPMWRSRCGCWGLTCRKAARRWTH